MFYFLFLVLLFARFYLTLSYFTPLPYILIASLFYLDIFFPSNFILPNMVLCPQILYCFNKIQGKNVVKWDFITFTKIKLKPYISFCIKSYLKWFSVWSKFIAMSTIKVSLTGFVVYNSIVYFLYREIKFLVGINIKSIMVRFYCHSYRYHKPLW